MVITRCKQILFVSIDLLPSPSEGLPREFIGRSQVLRVEPLILLASGGLRQLLLLNLLLLLFLLGMVRMLLLLTTA